jgi:opacity protein-like surface antigen
MKLRLSAAAVVAAVFMSSAAQARDGRFYAGVEAGGMFVKDIRATASDPFTFTLPPIPLPPLSTAAVTTAALSSDGDYFDADLKTGFDGDVVLGYDFGKVRAELEIGYRRAKFDDVRIADEDFLGGDHDAKGSISSKQAMINVLADLPLGHGFNVSAGPGVGWGTIKANPKIELFESGDYTNLQSHKATGWMLQGIVGVRKELGSNVDLGIKYRFVRSSRSEFDSDLYGNVEGRLTAHSLLASLTYSFGS